MTYVPDRGDLDEEERNRVETRVQTPSGTFTTGRVALVTGARCKTCGAFKVHTARPGHLFCFGCGVTQ